MANPNELVVNYLAAWNEQDAKKRAEIIGTTWTDGGSYIDAHRQGEGHAGIDKMIADAQRQFAGYRIRLISKIEAHSGHIRFSWAAGGTEQAPLYLGGTVFIFFGAALCLKSPTALLATAAHLPLMDRFIRREERQLERQFGEAWRRYQNRVPRWI